MKSRLLNLFADHACSIKVSFTTYLLKMANINFINYAQCTSDNLRLTHDTVLPASCQRVAISPAKHDRCAAYFFKISYILPNTSIEIIVIFTAYSSKCAVYFEMCGQHCNDTLNLISPSRDNIPCHSPLVVVPL